MIPTHMQKNADIHIILFLFSDNIRAFSYGFLKQIPYFQTSSLKNTGDSIKDVVLLSPDNIFKTWVHRLNINYLFPFSG